CITLSAQFITPSSSSAFAAPGCRGALNPARIVESIRISLSWGCFLLQSVQILENGLSKAIHDLRRNPIRGYNSCFDSETGNIVSKSIFSRRNESPYKVWARFHHLV